MAGLVYTQPSYAGRPTSFKVLGGPYNGYSTVQTINAYNNSSDVMTRKVLRKSWNTPYATGVINGKKRVATPFRAINNLGDFLDRQNYVCGGSNQVNANKHGWKGHIGSIVSQCDGTGVPASVCNPRFVPDSSDYTTYKKQRAMNRNYNDLKQGGDENKSEQTSFMRHF